MEKQGTYYGKNQAKNCTADSENKCSCTVIEKLIR
jgi:hypothetical protein